MAGPGKATWVKVKGKNGRMTTRAIGMTKGGGEYSQGQVITQSEFNEARKKASEAGTNKKGVKQTETKPGLVNAKGQSMLFDAGQYISPKAVQREKMRVGEQIAALREERSLAKDNLVEGGRIEVVAKHQAKIARINQQIKKLKDIQSGKKQSSRLAKGTTLEGMQSPNKDKSSQESRIKRLSKRAVTRSGMQYMRF